MWFNFIKKIVPYYLLGLGFMMVVTGSQAGVPRFAYVANPYDYTISIFYLDQEGRMYPNGMMFTRDKFPATLIIHPNGKFLYSATRTSDTAPIYEINPKTGSQTGDLCLHTNMLCLCVILMFETFVYCFH